MSFFSSIASFLSGDSLGAAVAKTAILGYTSRLLSDNVNESTSTETLDEGTRLQLDPSPENKIPVLYGSAYFGGDITDAQLSSDYKQMRFVLTLSEVTGDTIGGTASSYTVNNVYLNNNRVVFDTDGFTVSETIDLNGNQDPSAAGLIKVYLYKEYTALNSGPAPDTLMDDWTSTTHPMTGLLYAIVEVNYNRSKNVTGLPNCTFHITNSMDLPGDVLNDYMTNTVYGAGISSSDISGLTALNTYVTTGFSYTDAGGTTQLGQARINGLVNTATNVLNNIQAFAKAAGAWLSYDIHDGVWYTIINQTGTSVASFDDSNIIANISVGGSSLTNLYNVAEVQYQNTDILDQTDFVKIEIPSADLFDYEPENTLQSVLPFTNKQSTALKIGLLDLKQSRYDKIITFQADYSYLDIKAGELIDVTSSVYGYTNKVFRVISVSEVDQNDAIVLDFKCIEYDADVYTYNITEFNIETDDGLLTIGSIGTPNTPTVTNNSRGATPNIVIDAVVPSGIVDAMEFWYTTDTAVTNDADRTYRLLGTQSNTDGSAYSENDTVSLTVTGLSQTDLYVKVRGLNNITTGPYSGVSGLVAYVPVQEPDNLPDDVSIGDSFLQLGLLTLLNNLDTLFGGDENISLVDAILDDFFPSSSGGTATEQVAEALVNDTDFINDLTTATQGATVVAPTLIDDLTDVDTTTTAPSVNSVLFWDGTNWVPNTIDPDTGIPVVPDPPVDDTCFLSVTSFHTSDEDETSPTPSKEQSVALASTHGSYYIRYDYADYLYEDLTAGLGDIHLYKSDGTLVETLTASNIVIDKNVVELPFATRDEGVNYYILMDEGVVEYCDDCVNQAIELPTTWNFTTIENPSTTVITQPTATLETAPTMTIALDDSCYTQLKLTFNHPITANTGNITLHKDNGDGTTTSVQQFDVTTATISGSNLTKDYSSTLDTGYDYFITLDAGVVTFEAHNCGLSSVSNSAVSDVNELRFTVEELDPVAKGGSKAGSESTRVTLHNNLEIDVMSNIFFEADESIALGTGNIHIYKSGGTLHQTFDVETTFDDDYTNRIVYIEGNTLILNPTIKLEEDSNYYILADSGSITYRCGHPWSGISSSTTLVFGTGEYPTADSITYDDVASNTDVNKNPTIKITFNRDDLVVYTGDIEIYDTTSGSDVLHSTYDVTTDITLSGADVSFDVTGLDQTSNYKIFIDSGTFGDSTGNWLYEGMSDSSGETPYTFTTKSALLPQSITYDSSTASTNVTETPEIAITFNYDLAVNTGNIEIYDITGASAILHSTYDVTTDVTIQDNVVTFTSDELDADSDYKIFIDSNAFEILNNSGWYYSGMDDTSTPSAYTFDTASGVSFSSITATEDISVDEISWSIDITFNKNISANTGNLYVYDSANNLKSTVDVTTTTISNQVLSFNYIETNVTNITSRNSYYVQWDAGIVEETTDNFDVLQNTSTSLVTFSRDDVRFTAEITSTGNFTINFSGDMNVDGTTYTSSPQTITAGTNIVIYSENGTFPTNFSISSNSTVTNVDIGAFLGIQNWASAFEQNTSLQQVRFVATNAPTSMYITDASEMFKNCTSLTTVTFGLSYFTENITNFREMFYICSSLTSGPSLDTSNGTNFRQMFSGCTNITSYPTYDLSNGTNFESTFYNNQSVTSFPLFDLSSGVTAEYMFSDCNSCTTFPAFDTSNISNFVGMFYSCDDLEYLPAYDTSNATGDGSFVNYVRNCANLTCLSGINTSNVIGTPDASGSCSASLNTMFSGCTSLTHPTATQQQTIACSGLNYTNSNCP